MTTIDQLPVEMLIKVFSYLSSYGRVSLVNKHFYHVASCVNDSKNCARFYVAPYLLESAEHQSMMGSIQKTERKISKVSIVLSAGTHHAVEPQKHFYKLAIALVVKILKKFSATIKFFRLVRPRSGMIIHFRDFRIDMSDFLEMMSLMPNAEHLELENVFTETLSKTNGQANNECLQLNQLKKLDIHLCHPEFLVVFNRLPADVLTEFELTYVDVDFDVLAGFLTKQTNIKKLTLIDEYDGSEQALPQHLLNHLKLDSFACYQNEYDGRFAYILSKQIQLKSLDLSASYTGKVDESVLDVITNQLTELVTLAFDVDETLVESFKRITKLKKLKELTIGDCPLKIIEAFAELDHSRITFLNLNQISTCIQNGDDDEYEYPPMPVNVISALANSVPNLKTLEFDYSCECPAIGAIMESFNFVKELIFNFEMDYGKDSVDAKCLSETVEVEKCFNPKLTTFTIAQNFTWDESILTKLIAMYPNLEHLHIGSSAKLTTMSSNFELILNGFKRMNSLYIHLEEWNLTAEQLDCIIDRKSNLKSVSLGRLKEFTAEHQSKISAVFDNVKYWCGTLKITN